MIKVLYKTCESNKIVNRLNTNLYQLKTKRKTVTYIERVRERNQKVARACVCVRERETMTMTSFIDMKDNN